MYRFFTKSAHERAFKTPGYDLLLAGEVSKLLTEIQLPNIRYK
jgi:hypothetical protein